MSCTDYMNLVIIPWNDIRYKHQVIYFKKGFRWTVLFQTKSFKHFEVSDWLIGTMFYRIKFHLCVRFNKCLAESEYFHKTYIYRRHWCTCSIMSKSIPHSCKMATWYVQMLTNNVDHGNMQRQLASIYTAYKYMALFNLV